MTKRRAASRCAQLQFSSSQLDKRSNQPHLWHLSLFVNWPPACSYRNRSRSRSPSRSCLPITINELALKNVHGTRYAKPKLFFFGLCIGLCIGFIKLLPVVQHLPSGKWQVASGKRRRSPHAADWQFAALSSQLHLSFVLPAKSKSMHLTSCRWLSCWPIKLQVAANTQQTKPQQKQRPRQTVAACDDSQTLDYRLLTPDSGLCCDVFGH